MLNKNKKFVVDLPPELKGKMSPMPWDVQSGIVFDSNGEMICTIFDNWINPYDYAFVTGWNARIKKELLDA